MSIKIPFIESEIIDQYLYDENPRPWVIGFSGGKRFNASSSARLECFKENTTANAYQGNIYCL